MVSQTENSELPAHLAAQLAAMALFSDEVLWAATASSLSPAQQRRLDQLIAKGKERKLDRTGSAELESLLEEYDRAVLRRAKALAVLSNRGFELPILDGTATCNESSPACERPQFMSKLSSPSS